MSNQHKALELATALDFNAESGTFTNADEERLSAETIRTQHALIVQMREALELARVFVKDGTVTDCLARGASAAADKYLGEQA